SDEPWQSVTAVNINAQYGYRQVIGSALCQLANLPVAKAKLVQVRVNGQNRASSGSRMYGSYAHVEVINSGFSDRQFPHDDNGNLYKCYRDNSPTANLIYRGDTPDIYRRNYFKKSNQSKDDWTDLYDLTFKLSESPDDTYLQGVQSRVHIDAWLKFLAINILLGNTETSLSNGRGDDYYLYSGVNDPRFYLIPHDLDSIFQDNNTDPLRFWPVETLARLVGHPAVASQYYGTLIELMDTLLSPASLRQVFSLLSLSGVPDSRLQSMINYAENRYAQMRPLIEAALTLETTSPLHDGMFQAAQESVVLFGSADPIATRSVLVNGLQAQWDPLNAAWSMSQWNEPVTLIRKRSVWRYFDQYTDLGPYWYLDIDDSAWAEGPAELGYGDTQATLVGSIDAEPDTSGTQRNITTYFTHTFEIADPAQFEALSLLILRDDGALVYLNGVEIARTNMPQGSIDYDTPALRSTPSETQFYGGATGADDENFTHINAGLLLTGTNRLAVEIHQHGYSSSDISFDLEFLALTPKQGLLRLQPGLNRITAQTLNGPNGSGQVLDSTSIDIAYLMDVTADLSGTLTSETLLSASSGPYRVTDRLTVSDGVTLTIEAGTTVLFESNAGITVESGGCIQALGTQAQPIRMTRTPGSDANWQGLLLDHTRQDNQLSYVDFEFGDAQGESVSVEYATVLMDHVTFGGTGRTVLELHHPNAMIRHCVFPSVATEPIHGTGLSGDESLVFDTCIFGSALGTSDIIDFAGGARPGPILQCYNCIFLGGPDDGLDLDGTDAHVQGNLFMNFHKDNNSDGDSCAVATGQGGGHASQINLAQNTFLNNDFGVLLKEDCALIAQNNTFINTVKAVISFGEPYRNPPRSPGHGAAMTNTLFWNNANLFEHYFAASNPEYGPAVLTADYGLMPDLWHDLGIRNMQADPMIMSDGTLDPLSPAIGSGVGGSTIGATDTASLIFSGTPMARTWRSAATLFVSAPGITHYVYSLDDANGLYSEERSVDEPIVLNNLEPGQPHQVYAVGKNSAGLWQEAPTPSTLWQVEPDHITLTLHEIAVLGSLPAFIELYHDGPSALSELRVSLSQDPNVPDQFVLGSGKTLGPDSLTPIALDGRLVLNPDGDQLYLFLDGVLKDSLSFGAQLANRSLGRLGPDAPWRVTHPTPGYANALAATGNPRKVTLNEWLASPDTVFDSDFIELHNPSRWAVDIGGFFLTDNPLGQPDMHALPAFTLIEATSMLVLSPDSTTAPGHLPFKLSAEGEILGLLDPALNPVDIVLFGPQASDISQGRVPDGGPSFEWFAEPTPGQANPYDGPPIVDGEVKTLVAYEQTWSYNQADQALDSTWITGSYDDSDWPEGRGLLYVEGSALPAAKNTPLTLGSTTYYFRTQFTLDQDPSEIASPTVYTILDDGAIIYLNGQEILRLGVPAGNVTHDTYADDTVGNATIEGPFELDASLLVQGANTLAVEVHQTSSTSSDIVFGLQLDVVTQKE
ncbi:MAG: hypothetical protein GY809_12900, partial [Planctomycetes bacterium]|nr:hypothetical protein [Planctomycetota bacterium]